MYDYTIDLQTKQRINDMRRENERRHWVRDAIEFLTLTQNERAERKDAAQKDAEQHEKRAA